MKSGELLAYPVRDVDTRDAVLNVGRRGSASSITKTIRKKKPDPKVKEAEDYPVGEEWRCVNCGVRAHETPLKRKGPDGKRNICNACYVRYRVKIERSERGTARPIIPANGFIKPIKSYLSSTPQLSSSAWSNYVYGSSNTPYTYSNYRAYAYQPTAPMYSNSQLTGTGRENVYQSQADNYYGSYASLDETINELSAEGYIVNEKDQVNEAYWHQSHAGNYYEAYMQDPNMQYYKSFHADDSASIRRMSQDSTNGSYVDGPITYTNDTTGKLQQEDAMYYGQSTTQAQEWNEHTESELADQRRAHLEALQNYEYQKYYLYYKENGVTVPATHYQQSELYYPSQPAPQDSEENTHFNMSKCYSERDPTAVDSVAKDIEGSGLVGQSPSSFIPRNGETLMDDDVNMSLKVNSVDVNEEMRVNCQMDEFISIEPQSE